MKKLVLATAVLTSAVGLASAASATVVAVQSFESPALNSPGIQYGPDAVSFNTNETGPVVIPNFTFMGFSGIISNGSEGVFPNATNGTQAAFLQGYSGNGSEIDWSLTGLTAGKTYTLTFDTVSAGIVPAEGYTVSATGGPSTAFTPGAAYTGETYTFIPLTSSDTIQFVGDVSQGNNASAIDNLVLATVPEPATWALMMVGFGGMGAVLRSARRKMAVSVA
jgi:hypothetical protein